MKKSTVATPRGDTRGCFSVSAPSPYTIEDDAAEGGMIGMIGNCKTGCSSTSMPLCRLFVCFRLLARSLVILLNSVPLNVHVRADPRGIKTVSRSLHAPQCWLLVSPVMITMPVCVASSVDTVPSFLIRTIEANAVIDRSNPKSDTSITNQRAYTDLHLPPTLHNSGPFRAP